MDRLQASLLFIAWDLDNMPVQHLAHLPVVALRLATACCQHLLCQPGSCSPRLPASCRLTAYANQRTLDRLDGPEAAERALALVDGRLVAVETRRCAAAPVLAGAVCARLPLPNALALRDMLAAPVAFILHWGRCGSALVELS